MAKKARKSKKRRSAPKKRSSRRARTKKRKKTVRKNAARKGSPKKKSKVRPRTPELPAEPIGRVTHYFAKAKAAAVMIERDSLRVGDLLYFKGHTTHFKQKVDSLQIDRQPVPEAGSGQEVGIQVRSRTREHDLVFKLSR